MSGQQQFRDAIRRVRNRGVSISAVPPPESSSDYSKDLAKIATRIIYRTPLPSPSRLPIYVVNAAALPDANEVDFDALLPYLLARLPGEEELISGTGYEVIFFAGSSSGSATQEKKARPGWGWFIQGYHVLSRAMRKRLQKLYIVHERTWVRVLTQIMFSTIVSPKFRRKVEHASTLSGLALRLPIENLLVPPSAYQTDRRLSPDIYAPYVSGSRAFSVRQPLPRNSNGHSRLPRVLRETTTFILMEENIKTEGLFRIPSHALLKGILREAYDRGQKFVLWKDNSIALPLPPDQQSEDTLSITKEVDPRDCYGVNLAAGLIKAWYSDLREPLFPVSSYQILRQQFGDPQHTFTLEQLTEMVSLQSEWSPLPSLSRELLIRHLLPLLATIATRSEENKMNPENLAVCFAPALVCGPDQIQDARIQSIVRPLLESAVELWHTGLREACGVKEETFRQDLQPPKDFNDYEDPLEKTSGPQPASSSSVNPSTDEQFSGIVLQDNEIVVENPPSLQPRRPNLSADDAQTLPDRPPLPPRRPNSSGKEQGSSSDSPTRRKPAPPILQPPRYSTAVSNGTGEFTDSPSTYASTTDGSAPPRPSGWTMDEKKQEVEGAENYPHLLMPKRKALTAEQMSNVVHVSQLKPRRMSESNTVGSELKSGRPRAATAQLPLAQSATGTLEPIQSPPYASSSVETTSEFSPITHKTAATSSQPDVADVEDEMPSSSAGFFTTSLQRSTAPAITPPLPTRDDSEPPGPGYPSKAATTSHIRPIISSLARQVVPASIHSRKISRPEDTSAKGKGPARSRQPSTSLLSRMPPIFGSSDRPEGTDKGKLRSPGKLNLRKASVEDLRRVYEERASMSKALSDVSNDKDRSSGSDLEF